MQRNSNKEMLDRLIPEYPQNIIQECDAIAVQTRHVELSNLSDKRSDTGGLHDVFKLSIGARVMLTPNVDVSDGLVNRARGEVAHVVTSTDNKVTKILVKFDNPNVGLKAIQSSSYRSVYQNDANMKLHF